VWRWIGAGESAFVSGDFGADVTALIDIPAVGDIYADASGTPKSGQLPSPIVPKYIRAGTALSSGVTWSASTIEGNATFTISGSGAADLEITGRRQARLRLRASSKSPAPIRAFSARPRLSWCGKTIRQRTAGSGGGGGGGSSGSTTTLGDTTGTSYDLTNAISTEIFVAAGAGGNINCAAPLSFKRTGVTLGSGPTAKPALRANGNIGPSEARGATSRVANKPARRFNH
jgi:hypothetical protein